MEKPSTNSNQRFSAIFRMFMVFCVLVWLWGLGLFMIKPWDKGGEWLPEFPIVATCSDDTVCTIPYGELAAAKAAGKLKSLIPPTATGEILHHELRLQWQQLSGGMETKVSNWNFQITVRYRIEDDSPVLVEYQEINGKIFLIAIAGALLTLFGLYRRKYLKQG